VRAAAGAALIVVFVGVAGAQERPAPRPTPDLKQAPPGQRISGIQYCRGRYDVVLDGGERRAFREYDLSFKIDTSEHGPARGAPALVPAGRVGDRAVAVFAAVEGPTRGVRQTPECPQGVQ